MTDKQIARFFAAKAVCSSFSHKGAEEDARKAQAAFNRVYAALCSLKTEPVPRATIPE